MSKQKKKNHQPISSSQVGKKKSDSSSSVSNFLESNNFYLLLLGIVVLAVTVVRWRFVGMPLERDEGEYAYIGGQILKGITPYKEAYNMKLPGIYYMYALMMAIFGESYKGIHTGFVFMNAGTMILLYIALKKFFNPMTGILTVGFYGLMAMSNNVLGFAAHATHFAVFYVSLSLFFFSKFDENKKILFAVLTGGMLGMAFLMKQQAVYFILFGGIVFVIFQFLDAGRDFKSRPTLFSIFKNTSGFSAGVFIPYIIVLLLMLATGTFDKFWFWTVQYASKYASGLPWENGKELLSMTFAPIWEENKWIWILAIAGAAVVVFTKFSVHPVGQNSKSHGVKQKVLAISFALFACLATTPGFYFRQHYFIVALPAVALMAGIALDYAGRLIAPKPPLIPPKGGATHTTSPLRGVGGALLPLAVLFFLFNNTLSKSKGYYATENPVLLCKMVYGTNPFTESVDIANYIKANSNDTDKIAVLGSEPQIPFYANRKSATGHIYTYGLMEIHEYNLKMQEEMISEIENAKPLFLVFCNVPFSWLSKQNSPMKIFEWYNKYTTENYTIVGLVDIPDQGLSKIYWNADANRKPEHQNCVWIFKRKENTVGNRQ